MLGVLLKKQLCEKLSYFRRDKKNIDYVGAILTLALLAHGAGEVHLAGVLE